MIRFFVSSTFRDMHEERRRLHALVLPKVREYASENLGEFVDICDLRWGVDLEGASDESDRLHQLVVTCLDAIDDCKGYMICFLGDVFGTQLEKDEANILKSDWESRGHKSLDDYRVSLTQMELEYGVLQGEPGKYCCFKRVLSDEPSNSAGPTDTDEHKVLQKKLVNRIKSNCGAAYSEYSATWDGEKSASRPSPDFDDMLYHAMISIVENAAKTLKCRNWVEQEWMAARALADNLNDSFAGRGQLVEKLNGQLSKHHFAAVFGESGIGKSAFLAHWFCKNEKRYQPACCFIACGKGNKSKTVLDVAIQLIFFLKNTINGWPDELIQPAALASESLAIETVNHLIGVCDRELGKRHESALIVLDAINQLIPLDGESNFRWLLGQQFEHLNVVVSSIERLDSGSVSGMSDDTGQGLSDRHLEIGPLTNEDIEEIIKNEIHLSGPDVTEMLVKPIMAKADHAKPLYVHGVIDVLKMGLGHIKTDRDKRVFEQHRDTIEGLGDTIDELVWQIFNQAANYTGSNVIRSHHAIAADYQRYLGLLATSFDGLSDEDAREVLAAEDGPWDEGRKDAFETLVSYCRLFLPSFFHCDQDGRWMFGHDLVRSSIFNRLDSRESHKAFCVYGHTCPDSAEITEARQTLLFRDVAHASLELSELELFGKLIERANELDSKEKNALMHERNEEKRNRMSMNASPSGLMVQTLNDFLQSHDPQCYYALMHTYPKALERLLTTALAPAARRTDSKRRIAAIKPANLYVEKRYETDAPTELAFYWLIKQLIDIYDDISQQSQALPDIKLSQEYVCSQTLENRTEEEQEQLICIANLTLFCNNKLIKQKIDGMIQPELSASSPKDILENADEELQDLENTSNNLIGWFNQEIEGRPGIVENPRFTERCAAYINNIGQHYNAIRRVDEGFAYRMRALTIKVSTAFKSKELEEHLSEYLGLCSQTAPQAPESHEELAREHVRYWQRFKNGPLNQTIHDANIVSKYWESIATTYRALATDYFYWPELDRPSNNRACWYRAGCQFFELAISLMNDYNYTVNQKELTVARIRLVGMRVEELAFHAQIGSGCIAQEIDGLESAINEACVAYCNHARFDRREGKLLHKDITRAVKIFETVETSDCARYGNHIARLKQMCATVETYLG